MSVKLTWFPKQMKDADGGAIASATRAAGLSRCNAVVRDGYPTPPGSLPRTLRPFLDALADCGVKCDFATTIWHPGQLAGAEAALAAMAEHGVANVRLAQFNSGGGFGQVGDVRAELDQAKRDFEEAVKILEKHGLRGIYQVHHKTLLPSPSSLWPFLRDLPAERMAGMLDPGNQAFEGHEDVRRSLRLWGVDRTAACGVKDVAIDRGDGWRRSFVSTGEGVCEWPNVLKAFADEGFAGHLVFMPFYDVSDADDLSVKLKQEVDYVRRHLAENHVEET